MDQIPSKSEPHQLERCRGKNFRFKVMLRKCQNHGFEDIAQLNIFHNGLRSDTKMLLHVVAGGIIMVVYVE